MIEIVPFQEEFRQVLPNVEGNVDYEQFRDSLERIAELMSCQRSNKGNGRRSGSTRMKTIAGGKPGERSQRR